jgi:hypothetical protein
MVNFSILGKLKEPTAFESAVGSDRSVQIFQKVFEDFVSICR